MAKEALDQVKDQKYRPSPAGIITRVEGLCRRANSMNHENIILAEAEKIDEELLGLMDSMMAEFREL